MSEKDLALKFQQVINKASEIVLDKKQQITLVLTCLLAQGHLLIEDEPGVGKTTLAQTIAKLVGLKQSRIQFTNDLLRAISLGSLFLIAMTLVLFSKKALFFQK